MFPKNHINWDIVVAILGILHEILEILRNIRVL
jgi:hypothetical protein